MATASSTIAVNGKKVTIESDLNDGSYTVSYKGQTIGTGSNSSGGKINFKEGSVSAQKELLNLSGSRSRFLQRSLRNSVQNQVQKENIKLLNTNSSTTQKLVLRDMGYGNKLDIEGVTVAQNENAGQGGTILGNGTSSAGETIVDEETDERGGNEATYARYPYETIDSHYDYVNFTIVKYTPGGKESIGAIAAGQGAAAGRPSGRIRRSQQVGRYQLPMPLNMPADSTAVNWGADSMDIFQAMVAGGTLGMFAEEGSDQAGLQNAIDNATAGLGANKDEVKQMIKAWAAKKISGGGNVLGRTTGAVKNSNLELLFGGPNLRTFSFSYRLTPRDERETKEIKKMIRMIKRSMVAKLKAAELFLYTPDVYLIDFFFNGNKKHPFLNKIKPCALSTFTVNYTPDGAYMTYADGSPIAYQMDMTFQELEPVYDIDYDTDPGWQGMGY